MRKYLPADQQVHIVGCSAGWKSVIYGCLVTSHGRTLPNFLWMLPMAVAWPSF